MNGNLLICATKQHKVIQIWVNMCDKFHLIIYFNIYTTHYQKDFNLTDTFRHLGWWIYKQKAEKN